MFKILRKDLLLILAGAAVFLSLSYAIGFVTDRSRETVELQTAFLAGERPKAQPNTVRIWRKPRFEKIAVLNSTILKAPEKMLAADGVSPHTAHTTNPVPFHLIDEELVGVKLREGGALEDVAPTMLALLGLEQPVEMTGRDLRES